MRAVQVTRYGTPDVLRVADVERPVPGPGEVLVRVAGTTFNAVDAAIRSGVMTELIPVELPYTPGLDLAGTVEGTGERVIAFLGVPVGGGAAEFAAVPRDRLVPAPRSVPLADAAVLPVAGLTAFQGLFDHGGLRAGRRVLVNGAGGGVGGFAVQLAKRAGAHVIATASPRSRAAVEARGADEVVDYTTTPLTEALTAPVDLLFNNVSGNPAELSRLTDLVRDGGTAVSAPPLPLTDDEDRGVHWKVLYVRDDPAQLAGLVAAVDAGELVLDVSDRRPLADLASVHADGEAGRLRGRVVVTL
ncbi:NADP-dependent oxidoreductase [Kineococcus radiotolerans]|uniref:Alcohol dehydrogenase zinc-binding domain protein n=1 Tax=Kineococcus radiotolerans (strain ATCC BAA-149 / DSM 14245 / SRS30216) TaxID=266940 RepID=A6WF05_KINRD|nr:NADP-dependent oxidoreductase [Kineococcus radiotolerans]ABS05394.1 Alcohol dehydrogenase zinc-binding domain protein [Kineococcus radiotolerans SRS30216 = ATCC BAA-149]